MLPLLPYNKEAQGPGSQVNLNPQNKTFPIQKLLIFDGPLWNKRLVSIQREAFAL